MKTARKIKDNEIALIINKHHALELMNTIGSLEEMIRYDWHNTARIEADAKVKVLRVVDILRESFNKE